MYTQARQLPNRSPKARASAWVEQIIVSGSDWMMARWKRPREPFDVRWTETDRPPALWP